jgi:hypothetical protein
MRDNLGSETKLAGGESVEQVDSRAIIIGLREEIGSNSTNRGLSHPA